MQAEVARPAGHWSPWPCGAACRYTAASSRNAVNVVAREQVGAILQTLVRRTLPWRTVSIEWRGENWVPVAAAGTGGIEPPHGLLCDCGGA